MINKEEIQKKKEYYESKLKDNNLTDEENDKYRIALLSMIALQRQNRDLLHVRLYNITDFLSGHVKTIMANIEEGFITSGMTKKYELKVDDDYLNYLLQLLSNLKEIKIDKSLLRLNRMVISDDNVVLLAKGFYKWLGNDEINEYAQKVINDPSHYSFTAPFVANYRSAGAITIYDPVATETYILTQNEKNIRKVQSFIHEVAHCIDYHIQPFMHNDQHRLIVESIPCIIEYLLYDFLNELGINERELYALKENRKNYIKEVADSAFEEVSSALKKIENAEKSSKVKVTEKNKFFDPFTIKDLIDLEARVVAYGIYKQIQEDREYGLNNLCKLMKEKITNIPPDYSFIDLDREKLLELSIELANSNINTNKIRR